MLTNLIVALTTKNIFTIDFKSEMFCDQITCWFGNGKHDKVILLANLSSISVVVERLKYCGHEYQTSNFWLTCQKILTSLTPELEAVLKKSFRSIKLAFCCTCKSAQEELPHYLKISTSTQLLHPAM